MPITSPRPGRRTTGGFTLVELLVTFTVIGILLGLGLPALMSMISNSRERSVVSRFTQDFDWLRSRAANSAVTLTLNPDCTWAASINGAADATHSMTTANLASPPISVTCQSGTLALPATFTFTSQGFALPTGTLTFQGGHGQNWLLQILYSGSIVIGNGAT